MEKKNKKSFFHVFFQQIAKVANDATPHTFPAFLANLMYPPSPHFGPQLIFCFLVFIKKKFKFFFFIPISNYPILDPFGCYTISNQRDSMIQLR